MPAKRIFHIFGRLLAVCMAVTALMAMEERGTVTCAGAPLPGVTVVATMGDKKVTTTTDDSGTYAFPNLEEGVWTIHVEMLGFTPLTKEIAVTPGAPSPSWDMKLLSADEIKAAIAEATNPKPAAEKAATASAAASTTPAKTATSTATTPATTEKPATAAATPEKSSSTTPAAATANNANNGRGGRGGRNGAPSLRQAVQGFQRMDVNATGEAGSADMGNNGDIGMGAGDSMSGDAYVMGGSINQSIDMPQQNDWGFGGRGGDGMGGPGGPMGMIGMGGGGDPNNPNGMGMGGPGGGGPGAGGRGGRGGGGPGGGMGGPGGGFAPMGPGGGGRGGGRGGRGPGRGNANSFGNGRRGVQARYNGSLEMRLENSALDAENFNQTGAAVAKPSYQKTQLTASAGGPFRIPKIYTGNKINFNVNYSLRRNRNASANAYTVPTQSELLGNFAGIMVPSAANPAVLSPLTLIDPANGSPFPGNIIPASRLSTAALTLAKYFPSPNFSLPNSVYNYQANLVSVSNQDNLNLRMNGSLNSKNQFNGNFSWQRSNGTTANIFNWDGTTHNSGLNSGVSWTYHFTPRVFNRISLSFSRQNTNSDPYWASIGVNLSQQLGVLGNDQAPQFYGPPSIGFAGTSSITGLSDSSTSINRAQTASVTDAVTWIRGKHNFTFGGDLRRQQSNPIAQNNARGSFTFNGSLTGYDFADFLLDAPYQSTIAFGNADKYFRNNWGDAYVDDDFRLSPQLTLRLGLRFDYQAPVYELYGRLVNVDISQNFLTGTPVCASDTGLISGTTCQLGSSVGLGGPLVHDDPVEWQPRVGFAWRPFPKASTVVRGGIGIYYNTSVYQSLASSMSQQYPFSHSYTFSDSTAVTPLTMETGLIPPSTAASTLVMPNFAISPNFKIGSLNIWQLAIQQNLKGNLVATITYNGDQAIHQPQEFIPNTLPSGTLAKGQLYPCPFTGTLAANSVTCPSNFVYEVSGGNSNLQQISGQLQRRFRSGISANAVYTLTHSIDNGLAGGRGGAGLLAQDWMNLDLERGNSTLARRQTLSLNWQYSTGVGTRGGTLVNGWKGQLIKNWTVTGNMTVASGAFLSPNVTKLFDSNTSINATYRADVVQGQPLYIDGHPNPAAFVTPPAGQWGDAGRDILHGPMTFGLNSQFGRIFRFDERRSMDVRFDATNILNHPNFSSYNTNVTSTQFGYLAGNPQMRQFNVVVRFRF